MPKAVCERCGASAEVRHAPGFLTVSWALGARASCREMKVNPKGISILSQCPSMARALAEAGPPKSRQPQAPDGIKRRTG